ncbi:MAG: Uma2 family endonuclease [Coleofasciculaceae cyanobacterium RL_1_1]|nr:Uma2 family endonuclease [Coleofasciculaceae cyanobacterium RL_1_1]
MVATPQPQVVSAAQYLAWEPQQERRYELVRGIPIAMTGGSLAHNDIAINLLSALRPATRSQNCRLNMADAKVQISDTTYRYPDLVVSCDDRDRAATDALHYPCLVVEVLSPGTTARDRGEKLREYRSLPSVQEYLLIDSQEIFGEIYRRSQSRFWLYETYGRGEVIRLESIGIELAIETLYESVTLPRDTVG